VKQRKINGTIGMEEFTIIKTDFSGEAVKSDDTNDKEIKTIHPNRVVFRGRDGRAHTIFAPGGDRSRAVVKMGIITVSRMATSIIAFFNQKLDLESQFEFFNDVRFFPKKIDVIIDSGEIFEETKDKITDFFRKRKIEIDEFASLSDTYQLIIKNVKGSKPIKIVRREPSKAYSGEVPSEIPSRKETPVLKTPSREEPLVIKTPNRRERVIFKVLVYGPSQNDKDEVLKFLLGNYVKVGDNEIATSSRSQHILFNIFSVSEKKKKLPKKVDAILFIWDSQIDNWKENISALKTLLSNYKDKLIAPSYIDLPQIQLVILATKRDLDDIVDISKIAEVFNIAKLSHVLIYGIIVESGINIKRAFGYLSKQVVLYYYSTIYPYTKEEVAKIGYPLHDGDVKGVDIEKEEVPIDEQIGKEVDLEKEEVPTDTPIDDLIEEEVQDILSEDLEALDKIVFISYSRKDNEIFEIPQLAEGLKRYFQEVFYYEGVGYKNILKYMNDNIEKCDAFLSFCSENSRQSKYIEMEWQAALAQEKIIVPIFLDFNDIPALISPRLGVQFVEGALNDNIIEIYHIIQKQLSA